MDTEYIRVKNFDACVGKESTRKRGEEDRGIGKLPRGTKGVSIVVAKTTVDRVESHYLTERLVSNKHMYSFFTI